ncbi:MAG: C-terminal binding protein [Halofilum sp. (in: g-proteobacteria)]
MTDTQAETVRVVHLDPDGFGEVEMERTVFESACDGLVFDAIWPGERGELADIGPAQVLLTHYTEIDDAAMAAIRPEVIVRYATGVDGVDLEAATRRGIRVIRIPEYCDREVGEHVFAMALSLWRRLPQYHAHVSGGGWDFHHAAPGGSITDATFAFLGYGRKARAAAQLARALGCPIIAHDPHIPGDAIAAAGAEPVSFDDLFRRADVLSLHSPLTPETEGMVNARTLGLMRPGAILVNSARGRIIDEDALVAALDAGTLGGAGLDVLSAEPPPDDHPLPRRADVIVTPHAAWYSREAERRCRELGSQYAIDALEGRISEGLVNPEALKGE